MNKMDNKKGFIALTSVLVVSTILLAVFVGATSRSISQINISGASVASHKAKALARLCGEHALIELERTLGYGGDETIEIDGDSCYIQTVTGSGNTNRTLRVESTVSNYTYRMEITLLEISPSMVIDSWRNVSEFQ